MDKTMQETKELRDEELYALLDKAMEDERLCVSEALVQKTLQRVKEENNAKVLPARKTAGKKYRFMKYAGVAAAAVFVLVLGIKGIGGQKFMNDNMQEEAGQDYRARKSEKSGANGFERTEAPLDSDGLMMQAAESVSDSMYSTRESEGQDSADDTAEAPVQSRGAEYLQAAVVLLPSDVQEALADAGYVPVTGTGECWEYAQRDGDFTSELVTALVAEETWPGKFSDTGAYEYVISLRDGSKKTVGSGEPLDLIVRIETKQGILWCLLGKTVGFYVE